MMESIDLNALYSVTREELIADFDRILDMVVSGCSPILIKADGKPDLLLFGWDDYMKRFGVLYSKKEIDRINELCKNYRESET